MSSGNHAIATAYASAACGISAKVVMQASANPARVSLARAYGAEVLIAADGATGFAMATATLDLELEQQLGEIDVLIIAALSKVAHDFPGARIAVVLCGSNIDMESYNVCAQIGANP